MKLETLAPNLYFNILELFFLPFCKIFPNYFSYCTVSSIITLNLTGWSRGECGIIVNTFFLLKIGQDLPKGIRVGDFGWNGATVFGPGGYFVLSCLSQAGEGLKSPHERSVRSVQD